MARMARYLKASWRLGQSACVNLATSSLGRGHPLLGRVLENLCRCASVPTSRLQSWQRSPCCQLDSLAFLT